MASSDLTWTEANSPVNRIDEYRIYKSTNVLPSDPGYDASFVFLVTLPVVQDPEFPFGDTHPTEYSDTAVDFSMDFYCYRVDAFSVLVGEATGGSPQTGVGPSNIICIGTPSDPATLTGNKIDDNQLDLSWVNGSAGILPAFSTCVYRSVNGGPFELLAEVFEPTTTYSDTTVDNSVNTYDYYVITKDEVDIESDPSNTVTFSLTIAILVSLDGGGSTENQKIATSFDGITFELQSTPSDDMLDITFAEDLPLFIAVGFNGSVWTSPDALGWTKQSPGNSQDWRGVAWSSKLSLFAAVSSDGAVNRVMTSPDGINWTLRLAANLYSWQHVVWWPEADSGNGLFIAVTSDNQTDTIMTSPDGINWTARTTGSSGQRGSELAFSDTLIMTSNQTTSDGYITSGDGLTWTFRAFADTHAFTGVAFGDGTFIRIDPFGGSQDVGLNADPTGGSWAVADSNGTNSNDVKYGPLLDLFLIVANNDEYTISTDSGVTWAARTAFPAKASNGNWIRSVEGTQPNNLLEQEMVMVEEIASNNEAARSVNSFTWEVNITGVGVIVDDVAYSSSLGLYALVGNDLVWSSPDGIIWTERTEPAIAKDWQTIYWSDGLDIFVAGADTSGTDQIMTSVNGIDWIQRTTASQMRVHDIVEHPTANGGSPRLCAVGLNASSNPTGNMTFSNDGITWVGSTTNPSNRCVACTYDSFRDRVVVIETGGECNVSSDCDTYTLNINSADIGGSLSANASAIGYSPELDQLVFVSAAGALFSSEDGGASFTQRDANDFEDIKWSSVLQKWIACNNTSPYLKYSDDGITWTEGFNPAGSNGSWSALALGDQI